MELVPLLLSAAMALQLALGRWCGMPAYHASRTCRKHTVVVLNSFSAWYPPVVEGQTVMAQTRCQLSDNSARVAPELVGRLV